MPVTDATAINMAIPLNQVDKVIGIVSNTFTAIAPTAIEGQHTTNDTKSTGISESTYFQGIFTIDGGTTWNDFGTDIANDALLNGLNLTGASVADSFTVSAINNYGIASGTTYTVQYEVTLIAKNNQGFITPQPTNETIYYNSDKNYPKIFLQDTISYATTAGNSFSSAVFHNLGIRPKVSAWQDGFAGPGIITNISGIAPVIQVGTSFVTFFSDAALTTSQTSNIDYRIYLDPS